ncbi:MAG: hypothetical protein APR63_09655 [Desulfuromonas sp. SDB]|nr:MAG: hypothetical protein APR63_09655 [Desulfuromonas sp. SDB]
MTVVVKFKTGIVIFFAMIAYTVNINCQGINFLNPKQKEIIIDSISYYLNFNYVFPEVAEEMENKIRENYYSGVYDSIDIFEEFLLVLHQDLRSVCQDGHLGVDVMERRPPWANEEEQDQELYEMYLNRMRMENYGFEKLEHLPGNIGYLKLNEFCDAAYGGETAVAAMNFMANCDGIIIDLRENGGGDAGMIKLISSYLFENAVHLNTFYERPTDNYDESWTFSYVPGKKIVDVPVWVLTSRRTFSAAEEFTYNLQCLNRATIVGDTTGGGAHPVFRQDIPDLNIFIVIPYARAINPVTNSNWEQVGIIPDICISQEKALDCAYQLALNYIVENSTDQDQINTAEWYLQGLQTLDNPVYLDSVDLNGYIGQYGPRKIFLENNRLIYQRENRLAYPLIPMGDDQFMLEGNEDFRIKFQRDSQGEVNALMGIYISGHSDKNMRTD